MSQIRGTCRVLIVEEDPLSRSALALLLRHCGCESTQVRSVADALQNLGGKTHIISEVFAGGGTAVELLRVIRQRSLQPHVALMTALELDNELVRHAQQLEPELILRKPVPIDLLLEWLQRTSE